MRGARFQAGQLIEERDRWCARWRVDVVQPNGTTKRVRRWDVLAPKQGVTRRMAERLLAERVSVSNRTDYKPLGAPAARFADFADRWIESVMIHHKASTRHGEQGVIRNHLVPAFGQLALADITAERLQLWVSAQTGAANSIRNRLTVLKEMWTTAEAWGYVHHNPFPGLKKPSAQRGHSYFFSIEETTAIIAEVPAGWKRLFVRVIAETGMRPGEAAGLRRDDFDAGARILSVGQSVYNGKTQPPKTASAVRSFAVSRSLAQDLAAHVEQTVSPQGFLFCGARGAPVCMRGFLKNVLDPALNTLGIKAKAKARGLKVGTYAFRHGNVTELERRGVPLKTIQKRVGHSAGSDTTRLHYLHAVDADDVSAADMLGELFTPKREEGQTIQ